MKQQFYANDCYGNKVRIFDVEETKDGVIFHGKNRKEWRLTLEDFVTQILELFPQKNDKLTSN